MFLKNTCDKNSKLVECAFQLHQTNQILPDSYLIDMDTFLENAKKILDEANSRNFKLYFMLKQVGRNPYLAKELVAMGYAGAVVVDFKEAQVMMKNNIPIGNIGHLVQVPRQMLKEVINYGCEIITVYSYEKCLEINKAASELGVHQAIMLRVYNEKDMVYPGQTAGFNIQTMERDIDRIKQLDHLTIDGVTSFPCFLYQEKSKKIEPTKNLQTVLKAVDILEQKDVKVHQINLPSSTCTSTIAMSVQYGGTHGEPGHGFSGTTPAHAKEDLTELPCVLYVSEISHNFNHKAYCYGGGLYRRSHMLHALVGTSRSTATNYEVSFNSIENIDYHFELSKEAPVSSTVIMAFRFQIFVTRSDVVLISGVQTENPRIIGIYDSFGNLK